MFAPKVAEPQQKKDEGSTSRLSPHSTAAASPLFARSEPPRDFPSVVNEPGNPLDDAALTDFQTSFGHDFSSVRVHTDERAAESAASLSARAYTIGRHVVFGRGEYSPGTSTGRHLLRHELAHVVQQSRGGPSASGDSSLEAAADHAANQSSFGAPVLVAGSSAIGIACKSIFDEFTNGKYAWGLLKGAIDHTRPVATIVDDVNSLAPADRDQAIKDIVVERAERSRKLAYQTGQESIQTDPKLQAVFPPILAESKRVLDRYDAVLASLAPAGTVRKAIPGWDFTPEDYAKLQGAKKDLTMAPDSSWFPAKLQENLLKTLAFLLGPSISPPATEGVNALDFFHGHLVIKKDPAVEKEAKASVKATDKWEEDLRTARNRAIGEMTFSKGYRMTEKKIAAYKELLEKVQPSLASLMETAMAIPGAAVMYHTFEFKQPYDAKVRGQKLEAWDPRRHYVTPLDTNTPIQYTPPAPPKNYEVDFTHIAKFSFLIDALGAVHVRPFETFAGFTTLELSTITGTTFPEPIRDEK